MPCGTNAEGEAATLGAEDIAPCGRRSDGTRLASLLPKET
jgi:hypothetical protein